MILVKDLEDILELSNTTILELRKKLKMKYVTEEDVEKLKRFANDIKKEQGKVTLSTINRFLIDHKLEDYR